ncbi:MAG: acyl--CoA ligase [Burkholderiales bacterium]|nr:acyl--CoA ligase [Burkholderiales bacterium]
MNAPKPPFADLPARIAAHARERPEARAVVCGDAAVSYRAFDALADRVAAALQREGRGPGDCIAVCAGSSIGYLAVFVGALRAGLAVAPLAPGSTPQQLAAMAADAGACCVFSDGDSRVDWPAPRLALDDSADCAALGAWLAAAGAKPAAVAIDPDWPFNLIYSSGTTGTPKGIVQPHAMRQAHIERARQSGYDPDAVTLIATPLYSNTTLVALIPTLAYGGTVVLMPRFEAEAYLALAERHRATHTILVPVQYQRVMACPGFGRHDLSTFRFKACTSAPFHPELKADVLARWPGALVEYYGMTEGGGTCILQAHLHPAKLHTVGQPAPGHDIRLIDEQGREVPRPDGGASVGSGEVVGRSPGMMSGYHRRPEASAAAEWFDAEGRRYIRTGDIGRFDEDGFLVLHDRLKDMIISGGFNVYPSDLEAVLRRHPGLADAAVVGVPSAEWGETPVAFAVPALGADVEAEAIRAWVNAQVGKTQRLAGLRLLSELPRSAIGKVLKRELRERWSAA